MNVRASVHESDPTIKDYAASGLYTRNSRWCKTSKIGIRNTHVFDEPLAFKGFKRHLYKASVDNTAISRDVFGIEAYGGAVAVELRDHAFKEVLAEFVKSHASILER